MTKQQRGDQIEHLRGQVSALSSILHMLIILAKDRGILSLQSLQTILEKRVDISKDDPRYTQPYHDGFRERMTITSSFIDRYQKESPASEKIADTIKRLLKILSSFQ